MRQSATSIPAFAAIFGWTWPAHAVPVQPSDPPMSAERIARLPPEIRKAILVRCGVNAEAGHYFATYDDNSNVIRLHYSLLQCPNAPEPCEGARCLQTFVRHGHGYFLPKSDIHPMRDPHPRQNRSVRISLMTAETLTDLTHRKNSRRDR